MEHDAISEIVSRLQGLIGSQDSSRVSIMVETGDDEAVMIGTQSSYVRLAAALLDAANRCSKGDAREMQLQRGTIMCSDLPGAFDSTAHVVVRTICMAENEIEKSRATEFFRSLED